LESINSSISLKELKLNQIHLDSEIKIDLMTSFLAGSRHSLSKVILDQNMLTDVDILSQIYLNKNLEHIVILSQAFFKQVLAKNDLTKQVISNIHGGSGAKANRTLKKLEISLGFMNTVNPLISCLCMFVNLRELKLTHLKLSKLHFICIDNFMI